jgi:hypothetical protein
LPPPKSRVVLQKLTIPQLIEKFPTFYGTRRFITVSEVGACHHAIPHPQVINEGEDLQNCKVATNMLNKQSLTADGRAPGWGWDKELTPQLTNCIAL